MRAATKIALATLLVLASASEVAAQSRKRAATSNELDATARPAPMIDDPI